MSTHVVNEFHAKPGRGEHVLALLLELSPVSRGRPGCEAVSIRRNQDDPDNILGDTRWATRQHGERSAALMPWRHLLHEQGPPGQPHEAHLHFQRKGHPTGAAVGPAPRGNLASRAIASPTGPTRSAPLLWRRFARPLAVGQSADEAAAPAESIASLLWRGSECPRRSCDEPGRDLVGDPGGWNKRGHAELRVELKRNPGPAVGAQQPEGHELLVRRMVRHPCECHGSK